MSVVLIAMVNKDQYCINNLIATLKSCVCLGENAMLTL